MNGIPPGQMLDRVERDDLADEKAVRQINA